MPHQKYSIVSICLIYILLYFFLSLIKWFYSSAAGFHTALTIKNITSATLKSLEEFARELPAFINDYLELNTIEIEAADKQNLLELFLGSFKTDPNQFHFYVDERVSIATVVKLARALSMDGDYSAFRDAPANVKTTDSAIGRLFYTQNDVGNGMNMNYSEVRLKN